MSRMLVRLTALISVLGSMACTPENPAQLTIRSSDQLLLVTTSDWESTRGVAVLYERDADQNWRQASTALPVVVGRSGLAWDRRFQSKYELAGPTKREADGKSPAGIFSIGSAFGYEDQQGLQRDYVLVNKNHRCIDDVGSSFYNQIVDASEIQNPDWHSAEEMKRDDNLYSLGFVIKQNEDPTIAQDGSCIFFHVWQSPSTPTEGCTATSAQGIEGMIKWLHSADRTTIVQMPRQSLQDLSALFALPMVDY